MHRSLAQLFCPFSLTIVSWSITLSQVALPVSAAQLQRLAPFDTAETLRSQVKEEKTADEEKKAEEDKTAEEPKKAKEEQTDEDKSAVMKGMMIDLMDDTDFM